MMQKETINSLGNNLTLAICEFQNLPLTEKKELKKAKTKQDKQNKQKPVN